MIGMAAPDVTASDRVFKALADPSRRRILTLLSKGEMPLHRIQAHFSVSRPALIKHIRLLRSCRLVRVRREGRQTLHRLQAAPLKSVERWMATFGAFWDDRLARLKRQVEADP